MNKYIASSLKKDYAFKDLKEEEVLNNPFEQFEKWFTEAFNVNIPDANAMSLATCSSNCKPSVRTVLLKHYDERGFIFYTNYSSKKGNDIQVNPNASILFFWKELGRQIRIEGVVEKVSKEESEEYFHTRSFESQIAALASNQSSVIENRELLEKKFNELKIKYKDVVVPLPEFWGGCRLIPDKIEFWQGRQNRLHDRILYSKNNNTWEIQRLSP